MPEYWVCDGCMSMNDERNSSCYKCHVKRGRAVPTPIIPGATPPPSASAVYGPGPGAPPGPDLLTAALVGILATAIVTVGWILMAEVTSILLVYGFIKLTWWTGIVIGLVVGYAGTYGGQRHSLMLSLLATVLAAISITIGIYEVVSLLLLVEAGQQVPRLVPPAPIGQVVERIRLALSVDPIALPLVWLIPPVAAWLVSFRRLVGPPPGTREK